MASLDLVRLDMTEVQIVDPDTGEVLALHAASDQQIAAVLGRYELAIRDQLDALREVKRVLGEELLDRMDKGGEWTVRSRGMKATAPSPAAGTVSWDAELLDEILDGLVAGGIITRDAKLRAIKRVTTLAAQPAGIKALLKVPAAAAAMEPARRTSEPPRRSVTIKVNPGEV